MLRLAQSIPAAWGSAWSGRATFVPICGRRAAGVTYVLMAWGGIQVMVFMALVVVALLRWREPIPWVDDE